MILDLQGGIKIIILKRGNEIQNKKILLILICIATLLTSYGRVNSNQREQWQKTISQIELLQKTLTNNVSESKKYYDSIADELKKRMDKIDFSLFVINEEWGDIPMPEKEEDFNALYDILQQRITKLNYTLIKSLQLRL